ncbi:MAG: glycosyltransferase, partial [Parcubacteria group bacterium]|nr:glycosyltransferase [Parcubacteria group bacterium]
MKRILIFSLAYVPYVGGAELAIKEITDRIDPNGCSFDMITLRFDRKRPAVEKIGNVTVHRIGFTAENVKVSDRALPLSCRLAKLLFPFTSFFKALSLHREKKYDMIWAMMANQAGFGALFFKLWNPHIPYFLELQDGTPLSQIKWRRPITTLVWPLYRAIYRYADVIKAISNFIKGLAREVGFHGRIEVIPNGVD